MPVRPHISARDMGILVDVIFLVSGRHIGVERRRIQGQERVAETVAFLFGHQRNISAHPSS